MKTFDVTHAEIAREHGITEAQAKALIGDSDVPIRFWDYSTKGWFRRVWDKIWRRRNVRREQVVRNLWSARRVEGAQPHFTRKNPKSWARYLKNKPLRPINSEHQPAE